MDGAGGLISDASDCCQRQTRRWQPNSQRRINRKPGNPASARRLRGQPELKTRIQDIVSSWKPVRLHSPRCAHFPLEASSTKTATAHAIEPEPTPAGLPLVGATSAVLNGLTAELLERKASTRAPGGLTGAATPPTRWRRMT